MAVTRAGKIQFTDEQYKIARYDSSALAYAQAQGYNLKKEGRHWHLAEHDSMVFTEDGRWYWNSQAIQGGALEFLMHYEQKSLPEAVLTLCGDMERQRPSGAIAYPAAPPAPKPKFEVPQRSGEHYKRLFGYLVHGRGLNYGIVSELAQEGTIFPTAHKTAAYTMVNACFVGKDEAGNIKSAFMRGCSDKSTFKMEVPGSDKSCVFALPGDQNATELYVFEGAIDAISHASLYAESDLPWKDVHRISQGGNAPPDAITRYLDRYLAITQIRLCLDNDTAGQKIGAKILNDIRAAGYAQEITMEACPAGKDWNEFLGIVKQESAGHVAQRESESEPENKGELEIDP